MSADADETKFNQGTDGNAFFVDPGESSFVERMSVPNRRQQDVDIKQKFQPAAAFPFQIAPDEPG